MEPIKGAHIEGIMIATSSNGTMVATSTGDTMIESRFEPDLLRDERILWTGQPDAGRIFAQSDIVMIPFSLVWGGFAIFWEASALGFGLLAGGQAPPAISFFGLWGIPFVLIGLYMMVGRFFYKVWARRRTYYAVTNQRVLLRRETLGVSTKALYLSAIPTLSTSIRGDGSGSIVLAEDGGLNPLDGGVTFGGSRYRRRSMPFALEDIPNAREVAQTINDARER
jgi:hypothetical protein